MSLHFIGFLLIALSTAASNLNNERVLFAENWGGTYFFSRYSPTIGKVYFSHCNDDDGHSYGGNMSCDLINADGVPYEKLGEYEQAVLQVLEKARKKYQEEMKSSYIGTLSPSYKAQKALTQIIADIKTEGLKKWVLNDSIALRHTAPDLGSRTILKAVIKDVMEVFKAKGESKPSAPSATRRDAS